MVQLIRSPLTEFRLVLQRDGVRAAIQYLNRRSSHRFTALFRFEGGTLRNLHLVDRQDLAVERCPDLPVIESYCVYVRSHQKMFKTEDAACDRRVDGHPKQNQFRSYCGIPLFDEGGALFGTICHFDTDPVPYSVEEVNLLDSAAPLLVQAILRTEWHPGGESAAAGAGGGTRP